MKHAYLILAHGKMELLPSLLKCIDDARNDIYLHIDKKTHDVPVFHTEKARLTKTDRRIDVRWGDVSMLKAELVLFEAALASEERYAYFHLLSGVDLPLQSQDDIHHFCDAHQGKEFIGYSEKDETPEIERNVHRWHPFPRNFQSRNLFLRTFAGGLLRLQDWLHIRRNRNIRFCKGSQWVSVTEAMALLFVSHKEWILKTFDHTLCSDEIVMQTLCWNSPLRENLYNHEDEWTGNRRMIGWHGGHLTDWAAEDYERIAASEAFFARKFNLADPEFIERIIQLSART